LQDERSGMMAREFFPGLFFMGSIEQSPNILLLVEIKGAMMMKQVHGFTIGLLAGCVLTAAMPAIAATVKQYIATKAEYPLVVNGVLYVEANVPVLNYEGSTYIPLRAVGELLGAKVHWDEGLREVHIQNGSEAPNGNNAFRNVEAKGSGGAYTIIGEARVFEAMMSYAVSDGHRYLMERHDMLQEGAPEWSPFKLVIEIPKEDLPVNGTLTLEVFEYSAKDGSKVNVWVVPLESFGGE
jgi:hypothetical protein